MAETAKRSNTTDKLVIDIKVNVKKGATTQITNLTKSLTKLNEVVKNTANIEKYANALRTIGKELTRTTANKGVSQAQLGNKNYTEQIDEPVKTNEDSTRINKEETAQVDALRDAYESVDKAKAKLKTTTETLKDGTKREVNVYTEYIKGLKRTTREINGVIVSQRTQAVQTKKNTTIFSKFTKSLGRIALYRAIRTLLSGAMNSIKEGVENLREFDSEIDKSFKKIQLSTTTLKNSLASLFTGIIQGVQPYITQITDTIGNMVNKFNEAQAVLKGSGTYMKVLTSDTKEWQEQVDKATGSLLEFDKFLSLNKEDNSYTGFISAEVDMSLEEANKAIEPFEGLKETVSEIIVLLKDLWRNVIVPLWELIKKISPVLKKSFNYAIESVFPNIISSLNAIVGIVEFLIDLITFDFSSAWDKVANMKFNDWWFGFWKRSFGIKEYADGGMVEKGTSFIAGEAGAEVVHTSARGTGVTNIEQFSQAMLQALATYGVARGSDVSFKGDVYIDRTKAGQLLEGSVFGEGVRVGHFKRV